MFDDPEETPEPPAGPDPWSGLMDGPEMMPMEAE